MMRQINLNQGVSDGQRFDCCPQEELQYISMTEHLEERFSPDKRNKNKEELQPWQDEQQNPSESPERRGYISRPTTYLLKNDKLKTANRNTRNIPTKVLQSNNNSNFSIKLRNGTPNRTSNYGGVCLYKIQTENRIADRKLSFNTDRNGKQPNKSRKNSFCSSTKNRRQNTDIRLITQKEYEIDVSKLKTPINMILYPVINQGKRKKLFRKMQKFQNFVSVSLRK